MIAEGKPDFPFLDDIEAERIARLFHEHYERLAPLFGYETRESSAVPWEDVPDNNRKLMIATVKAVGLVNAEQFNATYWYRAWAKCAGATEDEK